jgi:hypothetical protein
MFQSLSQGDDTNHILSFGIRDNHNEILEKTNTNQALLTIIFSGIRIRQYGSIKDFPGIGKIKLMLTDVLFVLFFILFKFHRRSLTVRWLLLQEGLIGERHPTLELTCAERKAF